jgi:hypothetical protein
VSRASRFLAVLALSAGTLAYQILLVRIFAIEQFHHFATMAVGVAMLGVGAAGTAFSIAHARGRVVPARWFVRSALGAAVCLVLSPLAAGLVQVDPAALTWDFRQWVRMAWIYLVLAAPFAAGALAVLAAIAATLERPGAMYGASLVGSGLGAAAALGLLGILPPVQAIGVPAVLAALGAMLAAAETGASRRALAAAAVTGVAALALVARPLRPAPDLLPYKALAQVLAWPDAEVVAARNSPVGWVVAVDAPAFRHLPGLSLAWRGVFPSQTGVFVDGDLAGAVSRWGPATTAVLDWLPVALPFALGPHPRVLVLQDAAGLSVPAALNAGATDVTVVDLQPDVTRLARAGLTGGALGGHQVTWVTGSARAFAARTPARFDLVVLGRAAGASLVESFDHTVEAYHRYLGLLDDEGVLAVTLDAVEPARGEVRAVLTLAEALRRRDPAAPGRGLAVLRTWGTVTVLAKPGGFTPVQVAALRFWAEDRWFDLEWSPGDDRPSLRHNRVERPVVFEAARAATRGRDSAEAFIRAYPLDVRPATDGRPYPHHFVGFRAARWLLERPRGDWLPFAEWGHVALLVTLAQGAVLAVLLMGGPAALRAGRPRGPGGGRLVVYFAAIGVGFMAAEIAAIQQLTLLLGHPVYAFAAVLTGLLVASGLGSMGSDRRPARDARRVTLVLALLLAGYAGLLLPLVQALQPAAAAVRAVAAGLVLLPAALLMGGPFPLGVRRLAGPEPGRVAWAWAANGFASVVTAPAAALIALDLGHGAVFLVAAGAYLVAALAAARAPVTIPVFPSDRTASHAPQDSIRHRARARPARFRRPGRGPDPGLRQRGAGLGPHRPGPLPRASRGSTTPVRDPRLDPRARHDHHEPVRAGPERAGRRGRDDGAEHRGPLGAARRPHPAARRFPQHHRACRQPAGPGGRQLELPARAARRTPPRPRGRLLGH